jgi:hypothetical protein
MTGTLFFVHGTGVRDPGYHRTMALIADGLAKNGLNVALKGAPWGTPHGVSINHLADALPPVVATKSVGDLLLGDAADDLSEEQLDAEIWAQLLDDPLFELRLATAGPGEGTGGVVGLPNVISADQDIIQLLLRMPSNLGDLQRTEVSVAEVKDAGERLAKSEVLRQAALSIGQATDPILLEAVSRAVAALTLAQHRKDPPGSGPAALYDRHRRSGLVESIERALSPTTKGIPGVAWLFDKAKGFAKGRATAELRERRTGVTGLSLPGVGDILLYQRRGATILDHIASELAACSARPVVAVGHSLGGIMLVDLLSRQNSPRVDLLVTVGSQSPLFYVIDALDQLRPTATVKPFVPWLNIYDRNDFLSFCAERVFPSVDRIYDREVQAGVPFPDSHSAYWHQDAVYKLMKEFWP